MTGGLMQLVAYGAQDVYLTGDPMITHFKTVYRRHTNFAMECIQQSFNGSPNFGTAVSCIITRNGDLISGAYIETTLPELNADVDSGTSRWTENIGHHLIRSVDIEIGGQLIDKHYGEWLDIWAQLTVSASQRQGYYDLIGQGRKDALGRPSGLQKDQRGVIESQTIYIPLQFWFCRNPGLALPLVALQYHEVKINVQFADSADLLRSGGILSSSRRLTDTKLWVDYIYLDIDERKKFMDVAHEYLIDQLQFNGGSIIPANASRQSNITHKVYLNFNHPVKELVWVAQPVNYLQGNNRQPSNYTAVSSQPPVFQSGEGIDQYSSLGLINLLNELQGLDQNSVMPAGALNPVVSAKLTLNGNDRFSTQNGTYFNSMQPYRHHTNIPESVGINVYSFALKPEEMQPSGTCNFSKIDNVYLTLNLATLQQQTGKSKINEYPGAISGASFAANTCNVKVYAVNYNILRIMNGLGGVAYSN